MLAPRDVGRMIAVPLLTGLLVLNGARLLVTDVAPLARLATAVAVCFYLVLAVQYLRRGGRRRTPTPARRCGSSPSVRRSRPS